MGISVVIYYIFGIHDGNTTIKGEFGTSVYFALVTFTTLGYGDFSPVGAVRFVATAQALLGLLLTSLFMVTLVRKFSR
ncbi:TPA: ion channel [Vibrio diabolicus]